MLREFSEDTIRIVDRPIRQNRKQRRSDAVEGLRRVRIVGRQLGSKRGADLPNLFGINDGI
jgi:hypothetical protein